MRHCTIRRALAVLGLVTLGASACISTGDDTTINNALKAGGDGAVVQICPNTTITIKNSIVFTADNQELSTWNYPTDDSRAIILLEQTSPNVTALIEGGARNGARLLNIQIDGDREHNGIVNVGSSANIEMGGAGNGQILSYVVSKNPRGWSCMHVIEGWSGTGPGACVNATITNNDIGPCGASGVDSAGNGLWADGISMGCSYSLVQGNKIQGPTDGGIVLFGAPSTRVIENTIISSDKYKSFGAINMVDNLNTYNGSFANVIVADNVIIGDLIFSVGIAVGSNVWGGSSSIPLEGPATIANNTFKGNVTFSIPLSGWAGGITIVGNDVSAVNVDDTFAEAGSCPSATREAFDADLQLLVNTPTVTGPKDLQSDFVEVTDNPTVFICTTPPLPSLVTFAPGQLNVTTEPTDFVLLHDGITFTYDNGADIIAYNKSGPTTTVPITIGPTVKTCNNDECALVFDDSGNFAKYVKGTLLWSTNTTNVGHSLAFMNEPPWVVITDTSGKTVWNAVKG